MRKAVPADAPMLRAWDKRPHVRAAVGVIEGRPETESDWEWETQIPIERDWREFLIAELDGVPIGFMQIIDPLARNTRSHRFYERLGFRFVEERHFGGDLCRVYRLGRGEWRP